ncbi:MAG TPA: MogA/MoaB family molybdenum cofactor biosynthesis protein [Candidatus Polarisedimenticolaceae bacterium]|nr:MogA/MoaB family molybdenum cofactor biosynthesis protein [Candidatus Polarisedimenticolaceae bacterium]
MSHRPEAPSIRASVALLTVSDTRTVDTDRSGQLAKRLLEEAGHRSFDYRIVPDEPERVREQIERWLGQDACDAVVVNGGTGIAARDRTYEAVVALLDQRLPGFGELFRALSFVEIGSGAMLSRAVAGVARGRPLFSLPGSPAAVELALRRLIVPELGHLLGELRKQPPRPR